MSKYVKLDDAIANRLSIQLRYFKEIYEDDQVCYSDVVSILLDRSDKLLKKDGRL